jgi:hypothetical protein
MLPATINGKNNFTAKADDNSTNIIGGCKARSYLRGGFGKLDKQISDNPA